jgi:spore germination protein YaaH
VIPARARSARLPAVLLSALVAVPTMVTPGVVLAAPATTSSPSRFVSREAGKALTGEAQVPSIHYEQALAHEHDVIDFEPGGVVTTPFKPRKHDPWLVDGKAPRELPAGRFSGKQMREAAKAGVADPDERVDAGANTIEPAGTNTIEPAAYVTSGTSADETTSAAPVGTDGLRREVFGFLPYWEVGDSSTTLDWRTLSTVAYFSVGCESNGALDKTDADGTLSTGWAGWTSSKMTSVINQAHQNQTRVVLTISCFAWNSAGISRQSTLLGSATNRQRLAVAAAAAVRDRGADGINLDFEPIATGYAEEFTALVKSVRAELNKIAPGYQLTFDTLGSIGNQPIGPATQPGYADAIFIMGYDYRTDSSSVAGSISPLTGPRYDLTDTVKAYMAKVPASKLILGVPYYGRAWSTSSDKLNATTVSPSKYGSPAAPTYLQAVDLASQYGRRYDTVEQAPWVAYRKQTCTSTYGCVTSWRELYYDDSASLRLRYDLVNRTQLRGAGIWALGYEGTRPELRNALADKFLADTTAPVVGVATLAPSQRDEGFRVSWSSWDDSTITGYDVQVATDGGAWTTWLANTSLMSAIYPGMDGHAYAFRIRGTDAHGNVSAFNAAAIATSIDAPASIAVGGFATVLVDGLRMRANAGTTGDLITTLAAGDALQVIGGPVSADGYSWWQVSGPVRQWGPVDAMQIGGWVAASGNGETNAGPRRPVYATRVDAGITGLRLAGGGERFLSPNGDGVQDELHISWTNELAFDSMSLRIHRSDGTVLGSMALAGTSIGDHGYDWDGRIGGDLVPFGSYVIQVTGVRGATTYTAPSGAPVSPYQLARFGVIVGGAAPTSVASIVATTGSPTNATSVQYKLTFGGPIAGFSAGDLTRTGTATGCTFGSVAGSGAAWTFVVSGCSPGTLSVALKAGSVTDAVSNAGPAAQANAATLVIDRTAPTAATPRVSLRSGLSLASTAANAPLFATVSLGGKDVGGAGVVSYDVQRSRDGGAWTTIAWKIVGTTFNVSLAPGHTDRYRVRARDKAGNIGAWVVSASQRAYLPQHTTTIAWKGTWSTVSDAQCSGGSVRYSRAFGASASYTFTGRAIAWVSTLGPDRGAARIYIDGVYVTTIDTYSPTLTYRRIVFAKTWTSSGTHTLRIAVLATAGHPRVDFDALEVIR